MNRLILKLTGRMRALFLRNRVDTEMADEMRHHLELQAEQNRRAGMSADDARDAAQRQFGNVGVMQERAREQRSWFWLENRGRDFHLALRQLRKSPVFTAVALATLALGIGANTAIYSIVQAVVLRPLPLRNPESVVVVGETNPIQNHQFFSVSVPNFTDWRERSQSFESLVALTVRNVNLTSPGEPVQVAARYVSHGYLQMLGLVPSIGRDFRAEEDRPGANQVVLLSDDFWRQRFAADPLILGRSVVLNGKPHTVVGVVAGEPNISGGVELLVPMAADLNVEERDNHEIDVLGRLRPGVTLAQAQAELSAIALQIARENPASNEGWGVRVIPLKQSLVPDRVRATLYLLLGAVALLMLSAGANLSNMQLARTVARERELTVRAALGGSRGRLVAQLLTESLVLASLGGIAGVLLARWLVDLWRVSSLAASVPRAHEVSVDAGVLLFTLAATLVVGLLTGLAPAWRANRVDLRETLNASARSVGGGRNRTLRGFVVAQVALSFVLLAGAGLLLRSFQRLARAELGFSSANVLTVKLAPTEKADAFFAQLIERVRALPGVESVGLASGIPLEAFNTSLNVFPVGPALLRADQSVQSEWRVVRDDYFATLKIPLRRGRIFTPADGEKAPKVVIVNETLGRILWGDGDPLGRQIDLGGGGGAPATVVGVVGDVRGRHPGRPAEPGYYLSGYRWLWSHMTLTVRTAGDPTGAVRMIREQVKALDPSLPVFGVRTMESQVGESLAESRMLATFVGAFALLAVALTGLGVAGVTAFAVAARTREIGIRMALGAERTQVLDLLLKENFQLVALGAAFGLLAFSGVTQMLSAQLYEIRPWDLPALAAALSVLATTSLVAGLVPARRATKIDPIIALRAE